MKKILIFLVLFFGFITNINAEVKRITSGNENAKITIIAYESLTCSHCANFHNNIFNNLKKEYIDKGIVKFEHHAFPLDLAALNAEIVVRCQKNNEKKFKLLESIYIKQKTWAVGSDINKINFLIK